MKTNKPDARLLAPRAQEDLRRRVVAALMGGGISQVEAARTFAVSRMSIYNCLRTVEDGGLSALKAHKRGPKGGLRLAGHQAATVVRLIDDRCPDQLRLPFALWTRQAVGELIQRRWRRTWTCTQPQGNCRPAGHARSPRHRPRQGWAGCGWWSQWGAWSSLRCCPRLGWS